ncbi:MAG: hypothetical protein KAY24_19870 [Candidatus Eisenbacteria sp.]|nr:hypothetical protein [Candidatus Eisenbacteria bacterium]
MTEEKDKGTQTEPTKDPPPGITSGIEENERKSPAFLAMVKQLNESRTATDDLQKKLAAFDDEKVVRERAEKDEKAARERADLESKGEYQKVRDSQASEIETLKAEKIAMLETHKMDKLKNEFRLAASNAGVIDPYTAEGLLVAYIVTPEAERTKVAEHFAALKAGEKTKALFGEVSPAGIPPVKSGTVAGRSGNDWAKVYAERDGDDMKVAADALKKLKDYYSEHNEFPPKT